MVVARAVGEEPSQAVAARTTASPPNAGVRPHPDSRVDRPVLRENLCSPCSSYEAGVTVTSKASLTSLPSASFAVTVIVAVPVPVATTVRVEPATHMVATA